MSAPPAKKGRVSKSSAVATETSPGHKTSATSSPATVWPEWSDADLNAEKWGTARAGPESKGKKGKESAKSGKSAKSAKSAKSEKSGKTGKSGKSGKTGASTAASTKPEEEQFEDPFSISLPWSLKTPCTWTRPQVLVDPKVQLVVFSPTSPLVPDLVTKNREIFQSPLIRSIVSAVHMLSYIGQTRPFTIEWQTSQYLANTEGQPWKPWHHIYSLCRAGKGQNHNPIANTLGKYVVRLYWVGCWRKFIVDDRYPVDATGRWLLPVSNVGNDKEFELWPMLLTKALLKIARLTWTDKQEMVDFDVVTCLTGWAVQKIVTKGMDMQDIWEVCCGYSDHYSWDQRLILGPFEEPPPPAAKSGKSTSKSGSKKDSKKDKSSKASKSKDTKSTKTGKGAAGTMPPRSFHLTASCTDLRGLEENVIEDITPCYEHDFLIEDTRNIPLIDKIPEYDRNISPWKEYRWVDWAVAHGLWDRVYDWEIFKCMRIVSSMRKIDANVVYESETTDLEKFIKHSVTIIDEFVERKKQEKLAAAAGGKKDKGKGKDKKEKGPKKEKASSKGSSKKASKKGSAKIVFIDTSIWNNFAKLAPYITCISVYLKPSCFKINYVISDIRFSGASGGNQKKPAKKEDKKGKGKGGGDENSVRYIYLEDVLMKSRNEALYLFTDSVDFKLTMFSLAHLGNDPPKPDPPKRLDEKRIECKKVVCKLNKCDEGCICQKVPSDEIITEEVFVDTRKYAHVIVEDYEWKSHRIGDMPIFLKTCGYSSVLLDFEKGRHVKRIWVEGNSPYLLYIFCDTETIVGKVDEILDCMMEESEQVTQTCYNICAGFGSLLRYFGFPEYAPALKQFYKSYSPVVNLSKKQMSLIHDTFQEELIKVLALLFPLEKHCDVSRAFRILLLNPNFRIPYTVQIKPYEPAEDSGCIDCPCDDIDGMKLRQKSAIIIQSFFKMIYMKKLKSLQDPYNKKFQPVVDVLKLVYQNVFSGKVRPTNIDLLRSLVINKNLQSLIQYFPYYRDLHSVIVLKQFAGEVSDIPEYSWVPLVRRHFFCNTSDAIFIRVYIFCSLPEYVLRIFNNDTGKEIDRYTNNALVCKYEKNEKGYTILGYGWTNENPMKIITWKLDVVIDKILNTCLVDVSMARNITSKLRGNYVPNLDGLITKCRVKVQESCLGTFYFEASSPTAKIKIQILNKYGDLLFDAIGTATVLIPVVNLLKIEEEQKLSQDSKIDFGLKSSSGLLRSRSDIKSGSRTKVGKSRSFIKRRSTKSIERRSQGSSPLSKRRSKFSTLQEQDQQTEYILQAFVLEDSWPLTTKEWELAEKLRAKGLIESELNLSSISVTQENTNIKKSLTTASRKSATSSKKLKEKSSLLLPENEKPYWILTSLNDTDNYSTVIIDDRRFEQIKNIKRNIFESDISRFLQAQELRNEFRENNYIKWSPEMSLENYELKDFSSQYNTLSESLISKSIEIQASSRLSLKSKSLSQEKSAGDKSICPECNKTQTPEEFMYLKPPESVHKMLPGFETNKYDITMDKFRWLLLPEDEEKIFNNIVERVNTWEEEYVAYLTEMDEYLENNKSSHQLLLKWYEDIRLDSLDMMEDNRIKRDNLIKKLKELAQGPKKEKAGKGKKKK